MKDSIWLFFKKYGGKSVLHEAQLLKNAGIKTVFLVCDFVDVAMCEATDLTIVVTESLKLRYPESLHSKIKIVHDGVERPDQNKIMRCDSRGSILRPLNAVLVTSLRLNKLPILVNPPFWLNVTIVGDYLPRRRWIARLRTHRWEFFQKVGLRAKLSYLAFWINPRIKCVPWGPDSVYESIIKADFGIIPVEPDKKRDPTDAWQVKSENRLTLKMAVGLPVIATPIPAYLALIEQGKNGFLAHNLSEWLANLATLRTLGCVSELVSRRALMPWQVFNGQAGEAANNYPARVVGQRSILNS